MRMSSLPSLLAALAAAALGAACGGGAGTPPGDKVDECISGGGPTITISGRILYTRLVLHAGGLGPATETRPARFVDVAVESTGGDCFGRASTDAAGDYSLAVDPQPGTQLVVRAFSRTLEDPVRDLIVHEANPPFVDVHSETNVFQHATAAFAAASGVHDLTIPYTGGPANRPAVGFGLLDTLITCRDEAVAALGTPLPQCNAYTRVGNNGALGTSYYSHNARALAILGGAAGLPDDTDTDYFDDAVVAHEFMHFVNRTQGYSMSRGGPHSSWPLEPNFAWSEGLATGFGCLCLRDPNYRDTWTTFGNLLLNVTCENVTGVDEDTIAGEFTVSEILWDLGDGGAGPTDTDADGVNVPYADLFAALVGFDAATDAPYVGLFLQRLVALSASIDAGALGAFLAGPPEDQQISFPLSGADVWPRVANVGDVHISTIDATSDPGSPCRAFDSSRWYQLTLAAGQVVTIDLDIAPQMGSGDDLDLYLYRNQDVNTPFLSSTNGGAASEQISASLAAGTYIIIVQSCGDNAAGFTLSIN